MSDPDIARAYVGELFAALPEAELDELARC